MKKSILLIMLAACFYQLKAQQLSAVNPVDTASAKNLFKSMADNKPVALQPLVVNNLDKMPVAILQGNSKMPVVKLNGNSKMPVAIIGRASFPPLAQSKLPASFPMLKTLPPMGFPAPKKQGQF